MESLDTYMVNRQKSKEEIINAKEVSIEILDKSVNFKINKGDINEVYNITKEDLKSILLSL